MTDDCSNDRGTLISNITSCDNVEAISSCYIVLHLTLSRPLQEVQASKVRVVELKQPATVAPWSYTEVLSWSA